MLYKGVKRKTQSNNFNYCNKNKSVVKGCSKKILLDPIKKYVKKTLTSIITM